MAASRVIRAIFILLGLGSLAVSKSDNEARVFLKEFDLSYYRPQRYNLRDFKVDARIDGLLERLSQQLIFGKLNDVYFELSWKARPKENDSDYKKVEVQGMPNGFSEIKSQLSNNVLPRIDFIAPVSLSEKMKGYALNLIENQDGTRTIVCRDLEGMKEASEIILIFDKKKRLVKFVAKSPIGLETVDLKLVKEPWSQGKWVLSEYNVKKVHGPQTIESMSTLDYKVVSGFGLPDRIETKLKIAVGERRSALGPQAYEVETRSGMRFSNWKVNKASLRQEKQLK